MYPTSSHENRPSPVQAMTNGLYDYLPQTSRSLYSPWKQLNSARERIKFVTLVLLPSYKKPSSHLLIALNGRLGISLRAFLWDSSYLHWGRIVCKPPLQVIEVQWWSSLGNPVLLLHHLALERGWVVIPALVYLSAKARGDLEKIHTFVPLFDTINFALDITSTFMIYSWRSILNISINRNSH